MQLAENNGVVVADQPPATGIRAATATGSSSSRRTRRLYQTLIEHLPQRVFFKDIQSVFISVNPAFAADFGKTPEEFAGRSDRDFFPSEVAEKFIADDERILRTCQPETFAEINIVQGRRRHIEITKAPVLDDDGSVMGLLGVFTDVTARAVAVEERQRSEAFLDSVIQNLPSMVFIKRASDLILCFGTRRMRPRPGWWRRRIWASAITIFSTGRRQTVTPRPTEKCCARGG